MTGIRPSRVCLVALISLAPLSPLVAQTAPTVTQSTISRSPQTVPTDTGSYFTRCVEELDSAACEHARKLPLSTKDKSQVLTYEYAAQALCENKTLLDQAIQLDPQNAIAYFLRAMCSAASADEW